MAVSCKNNSPSRALNDDVNVLAEHLLRFRRASFHRSFRATVWPFAAIRKCNGLIAFSSIACPSPICKGIARLCLIFYVRNPSPGGN